jgi:hypothetical protein
MLKLLLLTTVVFGCKTRQEPVSDVAGTVPLSKTPPQIMYHYGPYDILVKNAADDGFTATEWDKIGANHARFRRGLYVSQHPAYNERYVFARLKEYENSSPWLMVVEVKPECTEKGAYFGPYLDSASDTKFVKFLDAQGKKSRFFSDCMETGKDRFPNAFKPLNPALSDETFCSTTLHEYFSASGIRIAWDAFWPDEGYWYILDRTCIKDMRADPEQLLRVAADVPEYWDRAPYQNNFARSSIDKFKMASASFYILLRALHTAQGWDQNLLEAIERNAETSDITEWDVKGAVQKTIAAAINCRRVNKVANFKAQTAFFLEKAPTILADIDIMEHISRFLTYGLRPEKLQCDINVTVPQPAQPAVASNPAVGQPPPASGNQPPPASGNTGGTSQACANGYQARDTFSNVMVGCQATVKYEDRAAVCGPGWRVCGLADWFKSKFNNTMHYWVDDYLYTYGTQGACAVSNNRSNNNYKDCKTINADFGPMHVCASQRADLAGNTCFVWNCGYERTNDNHMLGGCSKTAGVLCCL